MKADFSGYATKAGLKCSDGRTIMADAFKHQDTLTVPLVWQHGHDKVENVLGHAVLENRPDGVYTYAYFNDTPSAQHAKRSVLHKDITKLSIWANQLIQSGGRVIKGAIKEVSLVLAGANPGAFIDNITIQHSDNSSSTLETEAIIHTGLDFEIVNSDDLEPEVAHTDDLEPEVADPDNLEPEVAHKDTNSEGDTTMDKEDMTVQDVYDSMDQTQKDVVAYFVATALEDANASLAQSAIDTTELNNTLKEIKEGIEMSHNAFDQTTGATADVSLSHSDVQGILDSFKKGGSFAEAVNQYAVLHNITNVDVLFPDAQNILSAPEFNKRQTEWVTSFLNATNKTPFGRIKTLSADLTYDQARAKGYIKGSFKKEEFFSIGKRVTTPKTIYKKQKLDRDDMNDITDLDVVAWLKMEMRVMLDEEIARSALLGDGRDPSDPDKIDESNIRPIAKDSELFTTTVNVNIDDASSSMTEVIDAIILNRKYYKGTGLPNLYTTETYISRFMLLKDTTGRRIYSDLAQLASELRVAAIIGVEPMEDDPTIVGIIVNPVDYTMGATAGGKVSMFEDFDIDYNQNKYLLETRMCGALTKLKSALVIKKVDSGVTLVTATKPSFNAVTGVVTIPTVSGVTYKAATYNSVDDIVTAGSTLTAGDQAAIASGATTYVTAVPSSGSYALNNGAEDFWAFTRN